MANLTAHEMLELHEILRNQSLSIKKLESNASKVKDQELVSYMQKTMSTRREELKDMQQFIDRSLSLQ